ncbi:alpha/beta fold hydrolase [Luminiphilus sp.]|nr:alpha/beta fold hydrolase [Luminiphilus sp.]
MSERYLDANNVRLAYDDFGNANDPAILLIMGMATQMTAWPLSFCRGLADRGFYVVRYDNRDVGLSEKMLTARIPSTLDMMLKAGINRPLKVSYKLDDMATDALELMNALNLNQAHVVGVSMGGMIGQVLAAKHTSRVCSLTSIMSSSGDPNLPRASKKVTRALLKRYLGLVKPGLKSTIAFQRLIGSPGFPQSDDELNEKVRAAFQRSFYPPGFARHMAAIMASGSRVELLKAIKAPSLVIHGRDDVLVPLACGVDTARRIPNAALKIIDGMGHNLPESLVPILTDLVADHALAKP